MSTDLVLVSELFFLSLIPLGAVHLKVCHAFGGAHCVTEVVFPIPITWEKGREKA